MPEITTYELSERSFVEIKSTKAYSCYQKIIDVYLKYDEINKAIQRCVVYGHECEKEFNDTKKRDEFYDQADDLRRLNKISHICVIKKFQPSKYEKDIQKAIIYRERFYVKHQELGYIAISYVCN
ncbi:hypothetical protein RF11_14664 [Thelohanellus kitauei]|uniref:Uncharacterized protein n=1 Tax=Thelohanellus kitauei TaxID=669202 RepID=A0A0C2MQV0_THEKT|nr:hypothetical protein RF11_14664 [Thelohanellus kitauei]